MMFWMVKHSANMNMPQIYQHYELFFLGNLCVTLFSLFVYSCWDADLKRLAECLKITLTTQQP